MAANTRKVTIVFEFGDDITAAEYRELLCKAIHEADAHALSQLKYFTLDIEDQV